MARSGALVIRKALGRRGGHVRKVNPIGICADFDSELLAFRQFYEATLLSVAVGPNAARNASTLSEMVFHRSYVAFEGFLSAYFIGCVNRDPATLIALREQRIMQGLQEKWSWDTQHISYSPPLHPTVADCESMLNPQDRNLTFRDSDAMVQRAQEYLAPMYAARFAQIPADRLQVMDAAKAVRDCIAHQSRASFQKMNECLLALPQAGSAQLLRRQVNAVSNVGSYLKAVQNGQARTAIFIDEFRQLAVQLA